MLFNVMTVFLVPTGIAFPKKQSKHGTQELHHQRIKIMGEWISNTKWPKGTLDYTGNISQDFHQSEEAAKAVCRHLTRHGFGGEKKDISHRYMGNKG